MLCNLLTLCRWTTFSRARESVLLINCTIFCVFSLSPLYLSILKSFMCYKIRRFFQKVATSKLLKIYLYSPVDMKLYWHDPAMYVMVVVAWQGKLQLTCRLLFRLSASFSRPESCLTVTANFLTERENHLPYFFVCLCFWLSLCFCQFVIIDFPLIFSVYIRLLAFLFNYSCYCTGYERENTCNASLAVLCSNLAWDVLNSILSGFPQFRLPVNFVS
jgi:hypothetical protein